MKKYDLIVAGAGNAGLACAKAAGEGGLSVLVLEKNSRERLGHPWCDVVEAHVFERAGFSPLPSSIHRPVFMPFFMAPDLMTRLPCSGPCTAPLPYWYMDRKKMIACLLDQTAAAPGVEIRFQTRVLGPVFEGARVAGVRVAKDGRDETETIQAGWVADASGIHAVIGSRVPYAFPFEPDPLSDDDVFVALKEIIPVDDPRVMERMENVVVMGFGGGMAFVMPYWEGRVDAGVAVPRSKNPARLKELLGRLKERFGLPGKEPLFRGAGVLPARRCRTRLVGDGFLAAGDAGSQINPSNGGGIASSLVAGHLAGKTLVQASRLGQGGVHSLWPYARDYVLAQGADFAGIDVLRLAFQNMPEKDIVYCFKHKVMRHEDMAVPFVTCRPAPMKVLDTLGRGLAGFTRPDLLGKLGAALLKAQWATRLFKRIPLGYDPGAVAGWEKNIRKFFR